MKIENIGFVLGSGTLPESLLKKASENGVKAYCAVLQEDPSNVELAKKSQRFGMFQVGEILAFFKKNNVRKICIAGGVKKPKISFNVLNWKNVRLVWKLLRLKNKGDDALLTNVVSFVKKEGFEVVSATEFMPSLLVRRGNLTKRVPSKSEMKMVGIAVEFLGAVSKFDVSQACVVENDCVVALEGIEGTKEMILRMKNFVKGGAVLVKMPKVGQSLKVDMPTIGIETIRQCVESGFVGIVIKAEEVMFLNQKEAIELANESDVFIVAV